MVSRLNIQPFLFLTIGWFGIQMAMALDATQFQVLLDHQLEAITDWTLPFGKTTVIGMVLCLGPLAGIIVQPLMGWLGDRLSARGISRRFVMKQAVFYSIVCTLLFSMQLSLWALIVSIGLFFVSLNVLSVNYRALITQTSNRKAIAPQKGTVSGFVALFSGLGGFGMFVLSAILGNSPWQAIGGALILLATFLLVFRYAPMPKSNPANQVANDGDAQLKSLTGFWHLLFYAVPMLNLLPAIERRLISIEAQKPIFRLFLVVFAEWLGIQALRGFFILYATKDLGLSYQEANIPLAVLTLVTVGAALPIGKLADKIDNRLLWLACLLLFGSVCVAGYFFVNSMPAVLIMSVLLGISFAGMIVLPLCLLFRFCPQQSEGAYSGLYNLFMSVPQLYSMLLTGWLIDSVGGHYRVILLVGAVSVAFALLLTLRLKIPTQLTR